MTRIDEIRARLKATTPRPWSYDHRNNEIHVPPEVPAREFILCAPEDVAYLLERISRLEAVAEAAEAVLREHSTSNRTALRTALDSLEENKP